MAALQGVPPILRESLFAILFYWLLVALGARFTRLIRIPLTSLTDWERGLTCAAIGAGVLQYLPVVLSSFGRLSILSVRLTLAGIAMLVVPDILRIGRHTAASLRDLRRWHRSPAVVLWSSVLALFVLTMLVRAVVVDPMGDDDGYHLMAPRRWLEAGALVYLPSYSHTNAPMGFEMLYLTALATGTVEGAKLLHFGAGLLCLLGVAIAGRRLGRQGVSIVAITLLLVPNPVVDLPFLFGLAYSDLAVCWMAVTSLVVWLAWRQRPEGRLLVASALCAGFAGSFKFTALSVAIGLALIVFWEAVSQGVKRGRAISWAFACGAVALVPVLPWLYRNWRLTGNPVYPMLSSLIPTRDWSAEQTRVFGLFFRYYNWAKASGSRLGQLERQELLLAATLCLVIAFVVAVLATKRRDLRELLVFAAVIIGAGLWLTGLYFRFWLPGIMCVALIVGSFCAARWNDRVLAWAAVPVLVIGFLLRIDGEARRLAPDLRMATGVSSRDVEYRLDPLWKTWSYLNTQTPADAHVLIASFYTTFGASNGGAFWVRRPTYVTDSHLQGFIRLDSWPTFLESIKDARITYVVISDMLFAAGRHGFTFTAGTNEYPFCRRLVDEYGALLNQNEHIQVYRLRSLVPSADTAGAFADVIPIHERRASVR